MATIVAALARYWLDRPDLGQLRRAAACRASRRHRLLARQHTAITQHEAVLAELRLRVARMQQLLRDSEHVPVDTTVPDAG